MLCDADENDGFLVFVLSGIDEVKLVLNVAIKSWHTSPKGVFPRSHLRRNNCTLPTYSTGVRNICASKIMTLCRFIQCQLQWDDVELSTHARHLSWLHQQELEPKERESCKVARPRFCIFCIRGPRGARGWCRSGVAPKWTLFAPWPTPSAFACPHQPAMSSSQTFWILVQTTFTYTSLFLPTTFTYMKQWRVAILFGLGEDVWNPDSGLGENRLAEWKSYQKWHRKLSWLWLPPWCSFIIILKLIEQTHKSGHCRQIPSSTRGLSEYDAKFIFQTINCPLLCTAMEQCTKYLSLARPRLRSIKTALRNSAIEFELFLAPTGALILKVFLGQKGFSGDNAAFKFRLINTRT